MVAGGAWYYLRSLLKSGDIAAGSIGLQAFIKNLQVLPEIFGKFFLPLHFQLVPLFNTPDTIAGVIAIALFAFLVFRMGQSSNRRVLFGIVWFLLFIGPIMMFRNADAQYIFDYLYHRSYLPGIGLMVALAELLSRIRTEKLSQRIALGALPIFAFCGLSTFRELSYYTDAMTFYTEAIARTPQNALCYNNRGVHRGNEKKDHENALIDFTKAIEVFPAYVVALANRGVTYENLGRNRDAVADLEAALRHRPDDPDALFRIGNLRYLLNDFSGAANYYNRVLGTNNLYPRIYSKRAGSEAMLGQAQEALRDAEEALRIDRKDEEAYNNRGLARRLAGRYNEAIADFDSAISIKKDYSRPYNNRGTVYLALGNAEKALDDFSEAIALDSLFADAYSNRGSVEHRLGRYEEALTDLNTAIRFNPNFADAYQNRGVVKNMLRQFSQAVTDFNEAIALKPQNGGAYFGRGISKMYLQDHTGSCDDWRRAVALGATDAAALMAQYCR